IPPESVGCFRRQRMHEADRTAIRHRLDEDIAQRILDFSRGLQSLDVDVRHDGQLRASTATYTQGALVSLAKVTSEGEPNPRQSPVRSSCRSPASMMTRLPLSTQTA